VGEALDYRQIGGNIKRNMAFAADLALRGAALEVRGDPRSRQPVLSSGVRLVRRRVLVRPKLHLSWWCGTVTVVVAGFDTFPALSEQVTAIV